MDSHPSFEASVAFFHLLEYSALGQRLRLANRLVNEANWLFLVFDEAFLGSSPSSATYNQNNG